MKSQWNADRQVNARNRFVPEILRCKDHQIRPAPVQIVSKGHDIAFVFAGAERRRSKYGFARRAVLETVLLDRASLRIVLEQNITGGVARHRGQRDDLLLELFECGRVSVAMRSAGDPIIDARKFPKEPVAERAERYWSPNYIQHSTHIPPGREGLFNLIKSIPPTLRYESGTVVAEGDFVMLHGRYSGLGLPLNWIVADIVRMKDGNVVEHWDVISRRGHP
jgi:predicted SnoaL-like aldol condensation-catalyzing enzyme